MKTWRLQLDLLAPVPTEPGQKACGFCMGTGQHDGLENQGCRLYCPLCSSLGSFKKRVMITRSPKVRGAFPEGLSLWQKPPCCLEADAVSRADVFT